PKPPPSVASVRGEETIAPTPPSPTVIPSGSEESGGRVAESPPRLRDSRPPTRPEPSLSLGKTEMESVSSVDVGAELASDGEQKTQRREEARKRPGEAHVSQTAKAPV